MKVLAALVFSMLLFGCGQGGFTGTFVGNTALTRGPSVQEQLSFVLLENGNNVTGTWSSNLGTTGTVTANSNGANIVNLQMNNVDGRNACTLTGTGSYANFILTINFVGGNQNCGQLSTPGIQLTRVNR